MEKLLIFSVISLIFSTCSISKPSMVTVKQSTLTGENTLHMKPGWVQGTELQLTLSSSNIVKENTLKMHATLSGTCTNIADENIIFTIDGESYFYSPIKSMSECEANINAERHDIVRTFTLPIPFIVKLLSANEVRVSLDYVEGKFSTGGYNTAKDGFQEYLALLKR